MAYFGLAFLEMHYPTKKVIAQFQIVSMQVIYWLKFLVRLANSSFIREIRLIVMMLVLQEKKA